MKLSSLKCAVIISLALYLTISFAIAAPAADSFPEKPLRLLQGYAAGGGADVSFRILQPYLEKELGQPIEIIYREGASGQIAFTGVADSEPDGYTLGVYASPMLEFSILTQDASYTIDSFAFLGAYTFEPQIMLGQKDESRWSNVQELLAYAKEHPGEVSFSVNGVLNDAYLGLKIIEEQAGVKFNIIPFEGGNPARLALVGKHVDANQTQIFSAQHVWGDTKILAMMWDSNNFTDITNAPTFNEATGLKVPNLGQFTGFMLPAEVKTQYPERFEKLETALQAALKNPEYLQKLKEAGREKVASSQNAADTQKSMTESMELLKQYEWAFTE